MREGTTFERLTAVRALANVRGRSAALVGALGDPETQVRRAAGAALRKLQEPDSIPLLVAMLSSRDRSQRIEAMRVLAHYQGEESCSERQ